MCIMTQNFKKGDSNPNEPIGSQRTAYNVQRISTFGSGCELNECTSISPTTSFNVSRLIAAHTS